jgi:hypothetical protein
MTTKNRSQNTVFRPKAKKLLGWWEKSSFEDYYEVEAEFDKAYIPKNEFDLYNYLFLHKEVPAPKIVELIF